ncbi:epiplakin [Protobothrops mucrosquamatus]|uniref:epiplakin n=1 Tax=Protobothrops mucrosquamatus TaxID=103944 RepID=UPI0010FAF589|nr:epiplakin [Protobothrops mucrosquamatus]
MTVQAVQEAGWRLQQLPSDGSGACAEGLQGKLQQLSHQWSQVLAEMEHRQLALDHNLSQVREVSLEAAGLMQWLDRVELQLFSSKTIWGPPEATKDKLAALLELCEEMKSKQQTYQQVQEKLQHLLATCHSNGASTAEHSLKVLEQKWGTLTSRLQEQKEQLLQSPNTATEFHATLQELLKWVRQTEEVLAALPPPSYILDTVSKQRRQQQALVQQTVAQSKKLAGMQAGAACLTQDNGGPPSLVGSAKERLASVLQQVSKRGEVLEEAHQQAKQFRESWQLLLKWLDGAEAARPAPADAPPVKQEDLKALLRQHEELQRRLRVKRRVFEATLQRGSLLRARALLPADGQELDAMERELKEHWGALWSWAAERQQKLEEQLLLSGCFSDDLQSLLDWLCRVEPQLAEETPVAGDRDLVGMLMEQHKAFQTELSRRAVAVGTLRCSAERELVQGGSTMDARWLQIQMEELEDRWELIGRLSVSQQNRLEVTLRQAEEFHRRLCAFLSHLSQLEKSAMDGTPLEEEEEEEEAMAEAQSQLKELRQSVQCQQLELDCITSLGEEILSACHPDAVGTLQSWLGLAESRFQQLCNQVQQQEQRLQAQAASLAAGQETVERLRDWITATEETLSLRDQEPLPEDAGQLEELRCQHTVFMQELDHKQPEVEAAAKRGRQKRTARPGVEAPSCKGPSGWCLQFLVYSQLLPWARGWHGARKALPLEDLEPQSPLLTQLVLRWQRLWLAAQDRQHRLQNSQQRLQELEEMANFNFAVWRKRYLQWISHRKSRVLDVFRSIDRDQDGRITQQEFVGHVLASKFPTSLLEMKAVAKVFDVNRDGFIDYCAFISALHPSREILHRAANVDHIQEEVNRQVAECNCAKRFEVEQISATRYRFGECQQLRMVRILRSTLMVRVGGGWTALDEFLVKNDPCRVKGRTNLKINERYLSPGLLGRKGAGSQSAPASKMLSPCCSTSSLSQYSSASAPSSPVPRKVAPLRAAGGRRPIRRGPRPLLAGPRPGSPPQRQARSISGVFVEGSGKTTSLAQALQDHLIQPDVALALLEAQAATGGIVDPVGERLLPVTEALAVGLAGLEMKEKLLHAERAVTGFPDPYTQEKISLYQAIQKELIGRKLGLCLLEAQIATGGVIQPVSGHRVPLQEAYTRGYLDEGLSNSLSDPENEEAKGFRDPNTDQMVTYTELMRRCLADPARGLLLLPLKISFPGLRGAVCSQELLNSGVIDAAVFEALQKGEMTVREVAEMDSVQQSTSEIASIAGVAVLPTNECKSLYQALVEHLLPPGAAEILMQAQVASGYLIDPVKNAKFTVAEAVQAGVVGPELFGKLTSAERAVTGYKDPYTGETISLFQAMQKHLVPRNPGLCLLDAQLATGGVIDPDAHHRLPTRVALQRGHLDEETYSLLCNPTEEARGFFEPNSKERLSYGELLLRCVFDPDTGLCLLPLSGHQEKIHTFIDHSTKLALKNTTVSVASGRFKRRPVSLWKLLFSEYLTGEQRRALTQQFSSGSLSAQQLADKIRLVVEQTTADSRVTFEGLREKVTPAQLLSSEIINKDLFEKLTQGDTLVKEVISMGTVKKYLEGTGSIGGLLLPDSQERMSIYEAKRKGFLRPGTALILLEAQAATGHIIDPVANQRYSVDEALRGNIIGPDMYSKLLAAEKAVTGYKDPYTGNKISLFQAMKKDLIIKEHAIRLLEAQIATGGVIDPVNSHRLPVEVAYKRGFFEKKMSLILSDPSDDTKGFFDPNTHENLTYLQLKEKCIVEPTTGLCLLPLNSKKHQPLDDATRQAFRSSWLFVKHGRFQGQRVSLWDLLNSEYFSEGKRKEVFNHYGLRKVTLEEICLALEEEMKKWACIQFPALRGKVSAYHLLERGIIDRALFEEILDGGVSPEDVLRLDSVRRYLYGTGSIGGILLQPSNERLSLYEAMKRDMVVPGVALPLLEAQAATGFLVDPVSSQRLSLDDAVKKGLVGPELYEVLQQAEEAVTGYRDPFTGKIISLFQAMKKGLLADRKARQLMDAQLATGGVMDPHSGHYVPIEFAQKKGYLDEEFRKTFSNASSHSKAFSTLDRKERVSYGQLMDRCLKEAHSGIRLLPLAETASARYTEEQIQQRFKETFVEDKGVSLWDLLSSSYFTEEQKSDFLEKYSSGAVSLHQLVSLVQGVIDDIEMKAKAQVTFQGLRGAVPAVWLLDTGIISEKTFAELAQGKRSPREVSEMESVKPYLQGTGSIAGVFVQSSKEKMGIYQAMQERLLLPGVAAQLLSAQAATGSIMDPASDRRFGVEDAIKSGIVGEELMEELLQAEKAVSGFPDPYSGKPISVCQAIRKELLPARVGIPMLEAQLATGGIIDPVHGHHVPLGAAFKHGLIDEEMQRTLSQDTKESQVFFDPNAQESLTYRQLKDRCIQDPEMGLWLLPLSKEAAFYGDQQAMEVLKSFSVSVSTGRFKGQDVSLWDLLHSEYIPDAKRRELVLRYKETHEELLQEMASSIKKIIEETEQQGKRFTFEGLRKKVSANDLFQSQLIDMTTLDELRQGKTTVQEVSEMDSVKRFLEGCNFIAGVLIEPDREKMSLYQAMRRGLLRPGAALVLLEAQAATGYLIDPVKNKKLSVDEAVSAELIGREIYEKLLSAEKAVTGYTDPYTNGQISLFEAMNQELIVRSHGIRLLEAQIATGGVIDPVHSHRIPVEVAYKRGYFDEDLNRILLDPTDDTKGFFDPNTHENLTYLQLLERCIQDSESGLYMLQIVRRGETYFYIDEATKEFLRTQTMKVQVGRYKDQVVSVWSLLCSPYIQEQKRKDLVRQYKGEKLSLPQLCKTITTIVEETEQATQKIKLKGLRGQEVSAAELFNAEIIDKVTLDRLHLRSLPLQQLTQTDIVKRYLEGTGCIAGVLVAGQGLKLLAYEAMKRGFLSPEHALLLLEAQAATGLLTDLVEEKAFSVDQAISLGLVGEEFHKALLLAEKAVIGHTDPSTGDKISLFQAMKRNLVEKAHALRLLEAQMATGGIIDPIHSHRLPVEVACRRGYLDEETFLLLSDEGLVPKGFVDPNTQERITYTQLLLRCIKDTKTGAYLLPLLEKREYIFVDEKTKCVLSSCKIKVGLGKYKGQSTSLWELLSSDYVTKEMQKKMIKKYKEGGFAVLQSITREILKIIKKTEDHRKDIWFQGIRRQVTASELLKADIINEETMKNLQAGKERAQAVAKMDSVKRYLEGNSCIAGVMVPSRTDPSRSEKMTIYQAMWKGILRPGTALVLLEAQAATGFIINPSTNERFSVSQAVEAGVVGEEIQKKLLCAERAVTGYTDPNTGKSISLFQAMKKELILKEHGIRLLEAQIATGGIIDPVHSHRLPVEVAYKRGYFDEEMNRILSDPTDDTKGFFDPNTHENLTYLQLLQRCLPDPETGLLLLHIMDKGWFSSFLNENTKKALQTAKTKIGVGLFQDQEVSAWDLLFSRYILLSKRQDLLRQYKAGTVTLERLTQILIAIVTEAEEKSARPIGHKEAPNQPTTNEMITTLTSLHAKDRASSPGEEATLSSQHNELERTLRQVTIDVPVGEFQGSRRSAWELLFSKYVTAAKRQELLQKYQERSVAPGELVQILITLIEEMEEKGNQLKFSGLRKQVSASELFHSRIINQETLSKLAEGTKTVEEVTEMDSVKRYLEGNSCIAGVMVPSRTDLSKSEKMTIYQAMWKGILRPGTALVLLEAQAATGFITDPLANKKLSVDDAVSVELVGTELREKLLSAERAVTGYKDPYTGNKLSLFQAMKKGLIVKEHGIRLLEAQIATGGIIDPVHSHRLPVEVAYKRGYFDEEMNQILSDPTDDTKGFFDPNTHENLTYLQLLQRCLPDPETGLLLLHIMDKGWFSSFLNENTKKALQTAKTKIGVGLFQDQEVSAWDLLFSRYIPEEKRKELLQLYQSGILTIDQMETVVSAIVNKTEEMKSGNQYPSRYDLFQYTLELENINAIVRDIQDQKTSVWDPFFSRCVSNHSQEISLLESQGSTFSVPGTAQGMSAAITQMGTSTDGASVFCESAQGYISSPKSSEESLAKSPFHSQSALKSRLLNFPVADFPGKEASLWDVLHSHYVSKEKQKELLRLHQFGDLNLDQMESVVSDIIHRDKEGREMPSGGCSASGSPDSTAAEDGESQARQLQLKKTLRTTLVPVTVGEYQGQRVCVLDLLFSKYVPQDNRQELLELYRAGALPIEDMISRITVLLEEAESQREKRETKKRDVRRKERQDQGEPSATSSHRQRQRDISIQVQVMPGDKRSTTGCPEGPPIVQVREEPHWPFPSLMDPGEDQVIAGILKEPGREKLSIRQALHRGLLTHGTGLALLEHQAASGYIVDCAKNRLLSVRDARNAGLLDRDHFNTLLIAEKAVTGYTDPFSGNKISLFQAMRKGLLIKDHGIRLLEAQVATGGLIHPMHSHRLPVEVAYKWGYLDAEIFHLISNPSNHTKRCFDPNARENLTYLQLLPRCILDSETGLLMFQVMDKGCVHLEENARKSLKSATAKVQVGIFQGQEVSLWDLLFSRYILQNKRKELLKQFKSGSITLQEMTQVLTSIIDEAEAKSKSKPIQMMLLCERDRSRCSSEREVIEKILKSRVVMMPAGEFSGHKISVWDLLHSKYIPKGKRKELLKLFATGVLTVDQMEVVVTAIVAKVEEEKAKVLSAGQEDERGCEPQETQAQQSLKLIQIPVTAGQFKGQNMSVLDLLFSKYFSREKRQELLELYGSGVLSPKQMVEAVRSTLEKVEASRKSKEVAAVSSSSTSQPADDLLKAKMVIIPAGELRGQQMSVWDLLSSQYITRDKGEELLRKYREGAFTVQEMASMLTILASLHDLFSTLEKTAPRTGAKASSQGSLCPPSVSFEGEGEEEEEEEEEDDEDDGDEDQKKKDKVLKSRMVEVPVGEFAGRKVSLWNLLHSKYFPEKKRKEVLKLYRIGILSADQMETIVMAVVTKLCEEKAKEDRHGSSPPCHSLKEAGVAEVSVETLRERTVESLTFEFPVGEFQGRRVTVWDLLFSNYVSEAKRQELLTRYATGALNNQDLLAALTALITEAHSQKNMLSIPPLFPLLPREASYMMFGPPRASMQDLLCPQEQEAQNNGKVTYSEVTMTTTVVQGAEQKPE